MSPPPILSAETRGVAYLTLNRPKARNAFDGEMIRAISSFFKAVSKNKELRAVVIKGSGGNFCAGGDIRWMRSAANASSSKNLKDAAQLVAMCRAVQECPVPVLAQVQGACFGGGLGILSCADIGIAAENAQMAFSEGRLGLIPAVISSFVIPKIGLSNAKRYLLTAETFTAEQALRMGLAHEVCPEADLDGRAARFVQKILRTGPQASRQAKRLLLETPFMSREKRERRAAAIFSKIRASKEAQEGLSAFLEKRPPSWAVHS